MEREYQLLVIKLVENGYVVAAVDGEGVYHEFISGEVDLSATVNKLTKSLRPLAEFLPDSEPVVSESGEGKL